MDATRTRPLARQQSQSRRCAVEGNEAASIIRDGLPHRTAAWESNGVPNVHA
jgi:hypothetical protein